MRLGGRAARRQGGRTLFDRVRLFLLYHEDGSYSTIFVPRPALFYAANRYYGIIAGGLASPCGGAPFTDCFAGEGDALLSPHGAAQARARGAAFSPFCKNLSFFISRLLTEGRNRASICVLSFIVHKVSHTPANLRETDAGGDARYPSQIARKERSR